MNGHSLNGGISVAAEGKLVEKITENKTKGQEIRVYCLVCKQDNRHTVVVSADMDWSQEYDENFSVNSESNYQVLRCRCGSLSFRHLSWCSENQDYDWDGYTETLYPQREPETRTTKTFKNVPPLITDIYQQTIQAYNNESYILCAAGLRVIVEAICEVNEVKDGPVMRMQKGGILGEGRSDKLDGKIAGLCEKQILTKASADMLHEHRFIGNGAVHDLAQPAQRELKLAIEIIEHVFEQIFEIPRKAETLKAIRLRSQKKLA